MSLWKSLKESFLEEMSFDQNVEDIRGYEYFGTRQGCDLIILSVDCVHYMHVPASTFGSVQSLSQIQFFVTPWTAVCQTSVSITNSWSLLKLISIELVIHPTISSSVFPFSSCPQSFPASGSALRIKWPKDWSFSFSISPSNEHPGLISWWTGWISLQSKRLSRVFSNTTVQKALILQRSAFFMVWLSHPYMTTGKTLL